MASARVRVRSTDLPFVDLSAFAGRSMSRRRDHDVEFEATFLAHYDNIVHSVTYVCGDHDRAADATQEAFIRAYARWSRIRNYDNIAAWIRRIAINITRDAHRSETRRQRREERALAHQPPPTETIGADRSTTLDLLSGLPDRQRAIAALYYLDDMSITEISRLLDIADGTVRFHLSEARQRLRDHVTDRSQDHVG